MPKKFDAVPLQDQLNQIERDLSFHPALGDNPQTLTAAQVESFNRTGYVRPIDLFSTAEMDEIRDYFDRLLAEVTAQGGDSYSISSAHLTYGRVYDLLTDERIVACVRDLLGENVIAWGSHFFCKMPHDGKAVAWHQDASYWPLTPSKAVTVWLAIDDTDAENGNMRLIGGSQHHGHLTYRPSDSAEHNVLNQTIDNPEQYGSIVENPLTAGQMSIHSDLILHGSNANDSDRRRCALTLRYCAADVRASLEWNQKGVHVSGTDATGHWSNRSRPTRD
jgi:non-heme Fe2+,alpha-ketoglutarate-dependent halogenase